MYRSISPISIAWLALSTVLTSGPALAQDDSRQAGAEPNEDDLVPPELVEHVRAEYPPEAFQQGLEAEVEARLEIDEDGSVVAVEIVKPVGHGFDEAADAAMGRFKFKPAMRGSEPIPSILIYRYKFFIERALPPPVTAAGKRPAKLSGRVTTIDDEPLAAAFVVLTVIDETSEAYEEEADAGIEIIGPGVRELQRETDEGGRFVFEGITPLKYMVEVVVPGFKGFSQVEELVEGEQREVVYRLDPDETKYEVVVRGRRPQREVTRRVITVEEITKIPGTSGDALRAVQNLPGMARPSMMDGDLIIRGSSPVDSVYFFDSISTPMIYHFGGLTSVVNSDILEKIDFYPGNFSVRYGRATGGVVNVTTRAPKTDRFHAYIDADIWDVGALAEGPLSEDWSMAVTARRSYVDGALKAVDAFGDDLQMTVAPRYYDFQLLADYHPDVNDNLRLFFFGSDDRMVMLWDNTESNPNWEGGLDVHLYTYQAQAQWNHRFDKMVSNQLSVGFGYWGGNDHEGLMKQDWHVIPLLLRDELTINPGKYLVLRLGCDTEMRWGFVKMFVPGDYGGEGEPVYKDSANEAWLDFEGKRFHIHPAVYSELELTAIPRTRFIYGMRVDYHSPVDRWAFSPRFVVRYKLFPTTTLKAGLGLFFQPPDMAQADEGYGNPNLELTTAIHYSAGVEQELFENVEIGVEGFYKELRGLVTASDELVEWGGEVVPERFDNDGAGKVYGMEVQLKHRPTDRFFGWIAYTLMKSEREDEPGGEIRPFDYDQTHILTVVASLNIGWGIDVGLRYRLVSGNPYTPILGSSYDADSDIYQPIYGGNNSDRMPLFHQLDLRIDKKWQWDLLALTIYADVQNVYNQKNVEGFMYSYDFTEKAQFHGLPIVPSLGLKLEY